MIEEPYRWMEAIRNRREYIDLQLAGGSAIIALSIEAGILLLTVGRDRQKLFEIYDRIALGGIGHPGDLERLRMMAIEATSVEGFNRSPHDVSLRRLVHYSLSHALKSAFEQVYGPPWLCRLLFAELGRKGEPDLLIRLDYDGSFQSNGGGFREADRFAVVSGRPATAALMEEYLREQPLAGATLEEARRIALDAWLAGHWCEKEGRQEVPKEAELAAHREEVLAGAVVEAALLDRQARSAVTYRPIE